MENDIYSKSNIFKKAIKLVFKILYQILIVLCFILILIIVLQKVTNSNGSIAGYRIFRVITGSMIPQYDVGEVVISKEISPNKIKVGDDIVYMGTYGEYNGKIIMHEVVRIDKDENGNNTNFHAKGLNTNSIEDPQIKADQIYGVVKLKAGVLTVLYNLATNIYTSFVIITILAFNVFVSFSLPEKIKKKQLKEASEELDEDEDEDDDEEYDEDEYDDEDDENDENEEEDEEETEDEESDSDDEE